MEWFVYPSSNYSQISAQKSSLSKASLKDSWLTGGLVRSVQLVLVSHDGGLPHILLIKYTSDIESSWSLPCGQVEAGMTDTVGKNNANTCFRRVRTAFCDRCY